MSGQPSRAIRALMEEIVDYAGLFPPAKLPMDRAVAAYAEYLGGSDAWALGRFVAPAARLDELANAADSLFPPAGAAPWRISALAGDDADADRARIAAFERRAAGRAVVDAIEGKAADAARIRALRAAFPPPLHVYVELPLEPDPRPLIAELARAGARGKVRTGGVTADAFPAPAALARFLSGCVTEGVPFKATAGLHHPLRAVHPLTYEPDAPRGTMFGFLNVFLAAAWLREGMSVADAERLLDERDPAALAFDDGAVTWRGHRLDAARLGEARRDAAIAFGSCSFAEPVGDLRALSLLPASP